MNLDDEELNDEEQADRDLQVFVDPLITTVDPLITTVDPLITTVDPLVVFDRALKGGGGKHIS